MDHSFNMVSEKEELDRHCCCCWGMFSLPLRLADINSSRQRCCSYRQFCVVGIVCASGRCWFLDLGETIMELAASDEALVLHVTLQSVFHPSLDLVCTEKKKECG